MPIAPGERLGAYVVEAELGAGGMGRVFAARDTRLQRRVAIKVIADEGADRTARHRFERETLSVSSLNHPHILTVHEAGEHDGQLYLVTEFVDGGTLADWAASTQPSWRQIAGLLEGVGDGLAAAHAAGMVHRDVKPQNILVSTAGYAKLADFGVATLFAEENVAAAGAATETFFATSAGTVVGTPAYMSPEQAAGRRVDARSDIFSFGVVLYELLAGRRPFQGATSVAILHAILHEPPPALPDHLPAALRAVVEKALEKEPADRYQTMRDLVVDLRRAGRQDAPRRATSARRTWGLVMTAALILAGLTWALTTSRRDAGSDAAPIRTLAILPLKPLSRGGDEGSIGLGLADTIITRVGQIGGIIVRPTSAVRKFSSVDASALDAAKELAVDAVLDGTMHRGGDRLRVNMTLLRVSDGAPLWSQSFDTTFADVFAVEDRIATDVIRQLSIRLSQSDQMRLTKHHTSNPEAYEYYLRGVAPFGSIGSAAPNIVGNIKDGLLLLERAVAIDPNYALAYARLAWGEMFVATANGDRAAFARAQAALSRADALDPNLAESHLARHLLLWSGFSNYQIVESFEALKAAQAINPNTGHYELGSFLAHLGFIDTALRELARAREIDPTNESSHSEVANAYWYSALYNDAIAANRTLPRSVGWAHSYYLGAGRLDDARRLMDESLVRNPQNTLAIPRARLLAMEGRHADARALITPPGPDAGLSRTYHHRTYDLACIYALGGDAETAAGWMKRTVEMGMPNYPAFARDTCFSRIRGSQPYLRFMEDLEPVWEGYRRRMQ